MGIELGSVGDSLGEDGIVDVFSGFLGNISNLVSGIGYFAGGDLQEAIANGFMA